MGRLSLLLYRVENEMKNQEQAPGYLRSAKYGFYAGVYTHETENITGSKPEQSSGV
jgi:hypothetical protein